MRGGFKDITGQRFGKLLVRKMTNERDGGNKIVWLCKCDCGGTRKTNAQKIKQVGHCGCGTATCHNTHGLTYDPIYKILKGMIERCASEEPKKKAAYKDRGIKVCKQWRGDPHAFVAWAKAKGWEPGLQIDRKNNDKGYSPGNCRFVTQSKNMRNIRRNRTCTYKGKERLFIEVWEEIGKVEYSVAACRFFNYDWDLVSSMTAPLQNVYN